jgi:hypothetical protein
MVRVILTAQVEDSAKWEKGFRTHGELFRYGTGTNVIYFGMTDKNEVALYGETSDLGKFLETLGSPATAEAMAHDGVKRETVRSFVLDKEFRY